MSVRELLYLEKFTPSHLEKTKKLDNINEIITEKSLDDIIFIANDKKAIKSNHKRKQTTLELLTKYLENTYSVDD